MALSTPAYAQIIDQPEPITIEVTIDIEKEVAPEPVKKIEITGECNCYFFLKKTYYPDLVGTDFILNNLQSEISDIAVFYYAKSGLYHYAKVTWTDGFNFNIIESNYKHCRVGERQLDLSYPHLIGFFSTK